MDKRRRNAKLDTACGSSFPKGSKFLGSELRLSKWKAFNWIPTIVEMHFLDQMRIWVASLVFYSSVFAACEVLRYVILSLFKNPNRLSAQLLLEFVGTLQICVPMFDVGTILDNYGLLGVFIEITAIELANCYFMRDAVAHPCPLVTSCYRKSKAIRRAVYVFLVQLAAAYVSFFAARAFWGFGIHPKHTELLEDNEQCSSDLAVAITTGCLIEGAATFIGKAFEKFAGDQYGDSWHTSVLNCIFSGFLCALGINYTGMYANPIVAWACTFNCKGVSHIGHLFVYWMSPLIGWYLAELAFGVEDEEEEEEKPKEEKKKEK